jgi:carbon-monoxide dehydrogenase medium subunit
VIPAPFAYVRPASLDAALAALADPEAKAIAGGHSLLPVMKLRLARPTTLVDLAELGLRGIHVGDGEVRIGALTTYAELLDVDPRAGLPEVVRECAAAVGDVQVRNAGTVGGTVAHGDPASDLAAGLLAVDAHLVLASPGGTRTVPARDFFVGPYTTLLERQELLVEVVVPHLEPRRGSAYVAFEDPASGYPIVGCAAVVSVDGDAFGSCAIGLCGIGGRPLRASAVEAVFAAGAGTASPAALRAALAEAADLDDYRQHLAVLAIGRSVESARRRAA